MPDPQKMTCHGKRALVQGDPKSPIIVEFQVGPGNGSVYHMQVASEDEANVFKIGKKYAVTVSEISAE